jgi:hypothetical protein
VKSARSVQPVSCLRLDHAAHRTPARRADGGRRDRLTGAMLAVAASSDELRPHLADAPGVVIANHNAPRQVVLSARRGASRSSSAACPSWASLFTRLPSPVPSTVPNRQRCLCSAACVPRYDPLPCARGRRVRRWAAGKPIRESPMPSASCSRGSWPSRSASSIRSRPCMPPVCAHVRGAGARQRAQRAGRKDPRTAPPTAPSR